MPLTMMFHYHTDGSSFDTKILRNVLLNVAARILSTILLDMHKVSKRRGVSSNFTSFKASFMKISKFYHEISLHTGHWNVKNLWSLC